MLGEASLTVSSALLTRSPWDPGAVTLSSLLNSSWRQPGSRRDLGVVLEPAGPHLVAAGARQAHLLSPPRGCRPACSHLAETR